MSKLNPQNATAYVGPGVLRKGGKITPVPNGPLIKKKGPFKGSTLKSGGVIKKAQTGANVAQREAERNKRLKTSDSLKTERRKVIWKKSYETNKKPGQDFDTWYKEFDEKTKKNSADAPEPKGSRTFFAGDNGPKSPCKGGSCSGLNRNGGSIKKAQTGTKVVKGSRPGLGVFRTTKERTTSGGVAEPYKYKTESIDTTGYSKGRNNYEFKTVEGEGDKTRSKVTSTKSKTISKKDVPATLKSLNKAKAGTKMKKAFLGSSMFKDNPIYEKTTALRGKLGSAALGIPGVKPVVKNGGMLKRADGSYSKRGLWDNIRANKGSGKKPTKQMLVQEKKIKAKAKK